MTDGVTELVGVTDSAGVIEFVGDMVGVTDVDTVIEGVTDFDTVTDGVIVGVSVGVMLTIQHLIDRLGIVIGDAFNVGSKLPGTTLTGIAVLTFEFGEDNSTDGKLRLLAQGYDPTVTTDVESVCIFSFISLSVSDNIIFHNSLLFICEISYYGFNKYYRN